MSLMEETGARVRSGASPTDDVVTCYYEKLAAKLGVPKRRIRHQRGGPPLYMPLIP
ncbi:MAG: hypothetical protein ACJAZO_001307 [Myxococcota bacterium]|jgi:hypothetical protein